MVQAADFASESHVQINLYFYSWDAPKTPVSGWGVKRLIFGCHKSRSKPNQFSKVLGSLLQADIHASRSIGKNGLQADLCATPGSRCTDNLRRVHARQPHFQPADVAAEVLRGWSAEGLDEPFVAGVERVHVLNVIAA